MQNVPLQLKGGTKNEFTSSNRRCKRLHRRKRVAQLNLEDCARGLGFTTYVEQID